ncbi:MAG: ExbD/TolR family protein [Opitutales bacterium]
MAKQRKTLSGPGDVSDVDISPLIDMVFILLIFFIVAAVFIEEPGVEVDRVITVSGDKLKKKSILIAVTAENSVVYGGEEVSVLGVRGLVDRLKQPDTPVILQVDQASDASVVARVIEQAANTGSQVFVATSTD